MTDNSPNSKTTEHPSRASHTAKSATPFVLPSEPVISDLPNENPTTQSEHQPLKIQHDHTEAISVNDYDTGLQEAFAHRKQQKKRRKTTFGLAKAAALIAICGGSAFWYFGSSENQAKVTDAWNDAKNLASETKEQTDITNMIGTYDKALNKIEAHQDKTNVVAASLEGTTNSGSAEDDANYQKLLKEMSGGERTTLERDAEVQKKFGGLAKKIREKTGTERPEKTSDKSS